MTRLAISHRLDLHIRVAPGGPDRLSKRGPESGVRYAAGVAASSLNAFQAGQERRQAVNRHGHVNFIQIWGYAVSQGNEGCLSGREGTGVFD
jgi:hypothetical protein